MSRIVIVGGYGAFGTNVAKRLARDRSRHIVIAGRSLGKAQAYAATLAALHPRTRIEAAQLDATCISGAELRALGAAVVVNASGPFQAQNYTLARACIAAGSHYIDLADARAFVCGIGSLDAEARAANVSVVSGTSSVPGLSSAVVRHLARELARIDEVHIGISPGNSFDPGLATTASIVGAAGKPFRGWRDGAQRTLYGWQGLHRRTFPDLGRRWMGDVDVPDLQLLPQHYPQLATARFTAGLEVGMFHLGLWGLSWLVRAGIVRDLSPLAAPLLAVKRRLSMLGSDAGGMFVTVVGRGAGDGGTRRRTLTWTLIARSGDGPYVPAIASVILARRLTGAHRIAAGAMPCFGLFDLADFDAEVADLDITTTLSAR